MAPIRIALICAAVVPLTGGCVRTGSDQVRRRPNILLIVTDDVLLSGRVVGSISDQRIARQISVASDAIYRDAGATPVRHASM